VSPGAHDLGGAPGYGAVERAAGSEPVFSEAWQRRVFGLTFATLAQGLYNTDENRFARESMDPADYRASSYWELWFAALETNLVDKRIVSFGEIDSRAATLQSESTSDRPDVLMPELFDDVESAVRGGVSPARDVGDSPRYGPGDRVRALAHHPRGHTRLPAYAMGREGVVTRVCGAYVYPDTNAHLEGEHPHYVYTVGFAADELWGSRGEPGVVVHLDLWEPYLEPAAPAESEQ